MSEKPKNVKPVQKAEKKAVNRVKPTAVMLLYKDDAVAMGFTGNEEGLSGLIKSKIRTAIGLPVPERASSQNTALIAQLKAVGVELSSDAKTNEISKAMRKAILEGKFTPQVN